jgi:hypothetical protein
MHVHVAAADSREESLAENLCLTQSLGRQTALFQLCKYYGRKGEIIRRVGGIHGIYWSVETRIENEDKKPRKDTPRGMANPPERCQFAPCPRAWIERGAAPIPCDLYYAMRADIASVAGVASSGLRLVNTMRSGATTGDRGHRARFMRMSA